jgi:fumarate reductase flavoprotein subunit
MHGFNRLGGNSVSETVVSGMLVAEYIADFCDSEESNINICTSTIERFVTAEEEKIEKLLTNTNGEDTYELRRGMEKIMMDKVGIFRNEKDLQEAVDELQKLLVRSRNIEVFRSKSRAANPALVNAYRTQKMLKVALCVAYGALLRRESRGAHAREDYPNRDDVNWLKRTITSWGNPNRNLPDVTYEEIDIHKMELPPGFRGYGKNNIIPDPQSDIRQGVIDIIKKGLTERNADRFEIQNALMPYQQFLPEKYRRKNERLTELFDE